MTRPVFIAAVRARLPKVERRMITVPCGYQRIGRGQESKQYHDFDTTVPARIYGPLALHRGVAESGGWSITHVPTGCRLAKFRYAKDAREAIRRLLALDVDWSPTDPNWLKRSRKAKSAVLAVLKEFQG